jgi:hypothetical protein
MTLIALALQNYYEKSLITDSCWLEEQRNMAFLRDEALKALIAKYNS